MAEATLHPRTIGYVRVSTEEQSVNGQSLAVQEQQLRGWAQMQDRTLDAVAIEAGVSGGTEFPAARRAASSWPSCAG